MTIQINKNLDNYKEKVVFGLTAKQLIHVIIVAGICIGICLGLHRFIGIMGAAWLCFPIAAPIALNGFYEWNGLSFSESMKLRFMYMLKNRPLRYDSETESEEVIRRYRLEEEATKRAQEKKDKRKSKKQKNKDQGNKGIIKGLLGFDKKKKGDKKKA